MALCVEWSKTTDCKSDEIYSPRGFKSLQCLNVNPILYKHIENRIGMKNNQYINNSNGTATCNTCNKVFSIKGIHVHIWKIHGSGVNHKPALGHSAWNKGNTKYTDERILKNAINTQKSLLVKGNMDRLLNTSKLDEYNRYKNDCIFRFALNDYPTKFDFDLIKLHGWYKAKNRGDNPNGVSRDHIVSIKYGWLNNIPATVISHPANCQLVQQGINNKKKTDCWITIDELMLRIKEWDSDTTLAIIPKSIEEINALNNKKKKSYHKKGSCISCGNACCTYSKTKLCKLCDMKNRIYNRKVERPSKEYMVQLLKNNPIISIAKMYSVSDKAIVKWLNSYELPSKRNDIKEYISRLTNI